MFQQQQHFSSGLVQAQTVTSSGLLPKVWSVISSRDEAIVSYTGNNGLLWKVHEDSGFTVVAFEVNPRFDLQPDLVSSSHLKENNFNSFNFLCSEKIPDFSVNKSVIALFWDNLERLDELRSKIDSSPRLIVTGHGLRGPIVTGHGLGGPIASLFTLSLLGSNADKKKPSEKKKPPLCITFGSPLVGDKKFQQAISCSSVWSSCFLHVVSIKDPLLKRLNPHTNAYMPFGTFLFSSDISSTCFENPKSVLELLVITPNDQNQAFHPIDYGNIVGNLYIKAICKDFTPRGQDFTDTVSLRASIRLQLWAALGLTPDMQQQHPNTDINALVTKLEKLEKEFIHLKGIRFHPSKKLNKGKLNMAQLEWYKKDCKDRGIGYYDSYRTMNSYHDRDAVLYIKTLTNYWIGMVEDAEMKSQTEVAAFPERWIYAGTSFRRMVEPLAIAQYYRAGGKDYVSTKNRYKQFVLLEEWFENEMTKAKSNEYYICDWIDDDWNWDFCSSYVDNSMRTNEISNYNPNLDSSTSVVDNDIHSSQRSTVFQESEDNLTLNTIEENGLDLNTTSKNNVGKNNSCFEARVDEAVLSCQGTLADVRELQEFLNITRKRNVESILTTDSCFWAYVEEALLQLKNVNENEEAKGKLREFEEYVYESLKKYEVSPEIFLERSSYMKWWNQYKGISGNAALKYFMTNPDHLVQYSNGDYNFSPEVL